MNNSQVAHVWAQQRKPSGKGSSFYFEGPVIFSYGPHFPIARFVTDARGLQVVLFTTATYWQATSKHLSFTRNALHGLPIRVFNVPHVNADNDGRHSDNLWHYCDTFNGLLLKASRARAHAARYIDKAGELQKECFEYCKAFALAVPAELQVDISPEVIASARVQADRARAQDAEQRKAREERAEKEWSEWAADWRAGKAGDRWGYPGHTMLRLSADGESVETSRGASVPILDGLKLWRSVHLCKLGNRAYMVPPGEPMAVGEFHLREIQADGTCIVGCHQLDYAESLLFAQSRGWAS